MRSPAGSPPGCRPPCPVPQPRRRTAPRPEIPADARHLHRLRHPLGQPHPGHRPGSRCMGARVRRRLPAAPRPATPTLETGIPDPAAPAVSSPDHDVSPAEDEQARQHSGENEHPASPADAVPGSSTDTETALPAACRNAADLRQLAAAYLLSIDTGPAGARGTQLTVVHDRRPDRAAARRHQRHQRGRVPAGPRRGSRLSRRLPPPPAASAPLPGRPRTARPRRAGHA